jgi:hypothetical protein
MFYSTDHSYYITDDEKSLLNLTAERQSWLKLVARKNTLLAYRCQWHKPIFFFVICWA